MGDQLDRERRAIEKVAKRIQDHTGKSYSEARREAQKIAEKTDREKQR